MKALLFVALSAVLLSTVGCKKSSDEPSANANSWKVGNTSYTTMYAFRVTPSNGDPALTGWDRTPSPSMDYTKLNSWAVSFKTMPTTSGTYKIVGYPSSGFLANADEVYITAFTAGTTYVSTGAGNLMATVTVTGNKIAVTVPQIPTMTTSGTASTFDGDLREM